ncbi:MAG: hypothetical protein R6X15_00060 [Pseudomonadota bacterium]
MSKAPSIFGRKQLAVAVSAAILTACGGGSSNNNNDDDTSPSSSGGNYTLSTVGGTGGKATWGYGGDGGAINVYTEGDKGGVAVVRSGSADASFSSQRGGITPFLGVHPLEVTADTTVIKPNLWTDSQKYDGQPPSSHGLSTGDLYLDDNRVLRIFDGESAEYVVDTWVGDDIDYTRDPEVDDGRYYRYDNELYVAIAGDNVANLAAAGTPYYQGYADNIFLADEDDTVPDPEATGLSVAAGVTLTLELNDTTEADIDFRNDIVNRGVITTADFTATSRGRLRLNVDGSLFNHGTISTAGTDETRNAGSINIWAEYAAFNSGTITSAGADTTSSTDGGNADYLNFMSGYYTENTGTLNAAGGDSDNADGGSGDNIFIYSERGPVRNSGPLIATGGTGYGEDGGHGGSVVIMNNYAGDVLNSGDIDTSGGEGHAGWGGDGGEVNFYAYGGALISSGDITTVGGDSSTNEDAGDGGDVYAWISNGYSSWNYGTTPHKEVAFSGDIMTAGGTTGGDVNSGDGDGGNGGDFEIYTGDYDNGNEYTTGEAGVTLYGYNTLDTRGGSGQYPGEGGNVSLYAGYGWDDALYGYTTGPVVNHADILASAGAYTGSDSTGTHYAQGGGVSIETSYYYAEDNPEATATNTGDITSHGADGRNASSRYRLRGGGVWMWGFNGTDNSGSIAVNGGNDLSEDGSLNSYGGRGGVVDLYAELGAVVNSGAIDSHGGDAEAWGGPGSWWTAFYGPTVNNTGAIRGSGGDALEEVGGSGGYGGWVWMMGSNGFASVQNSGAVSLTPGANYVSYYGTYEGRENGYYKVIGPGCTGDCDQFN